MGGSAASHAAGESAATATCLTTRCPCPRRAPLPPLSLPAAAKEAGSRGVIAASAGNHALALAYHGQDLGVPVTVVMPRIAPITKIQNCRELNANVLIHGSHIGEARERAMELAKEHGEWWSHHHDDDAAPWSSPSGAVVVVLIRALLVAAPTAFPALLVRVPARACLLLLACRLHVHQRV